MENIYTVIYNINILYNILVLYKNTSYEYILYHYTSYTSIKYKVRISMLMYSMATFEI